MINLARCQFPNPELLIGFNLYFGLLQDIRDDIAPAQGHNVDALEFEFVFFNESAHHFKCFASLTQDGTKILVSRDGPFNRTDLTRYHELALIEQFA
jgi:hypothetical protein